MEDIKQIDKYGEWFHMELLRYYCSFIKCHALPDNDESDYLHFDFSEDGIYTIQYKDLIYKAKEESEKLIAKHADGNIQ